MKYLFLISFLICWALDSQAQDLIISKDKAELKVYISKIDQVSVFYRKTALQTDSIETMLLSDIEEIKFNYYQKEQQTEQIQGIPGQDLIVKKGSGEKLLVFIEKTTIQKVFYRKGKGSENPLDSIPLAEVELIKYDILEANETVAPEDKTIPIEEEAFEPSKNVIAAQVFGLGGVLSFNYERIVFSSEKLFLNVGGGIGIGFFSTSFSHYFSVNFGRRGHYLEVGIGGSYMRGALPFQDSYSMYALAPTIGYKLQLHKGFFLRAHGNIAIVPHYNDAFSDRFPLPVFPYTGVSLGYSF